MSSQKHTLGSLFAGIGVSGWGALEPRILCALKTRTPVNLVGDRGTSKTEFCARIARALLGKKCNFQKYDTPDLSLDDVLGFRNLKDMEAGKMSYIATGTAIWNKNVVLWDEPNRASPLFQSKLLEVIRTGTIHGMPTAVQFQFGACNPPRKTKGSVGHDVHFMPDALAARFFHVEVPRVSAMLYDLAMEGSDVRNAFDKNIDLEIGEACEPFALLWNEFNGTKPTKEERHNAQRVVRYVMQNLDNDSSVDNFFDIRAAIRATNMIAEYFLLCRIAHVPNDMASDVVAIVCGNIAELSKLTRTDLSQYSNNIAVSVTAALSTISTNSNAPNKNMQPIVSHAFSLLRENKLDALQVSELVNRIGTIGTREADLADAYAGLLKKVGDNNKYRSPAFRRAHEAALGALCAVGPFLGNNFIPAPSPGAVWKAEALHKVWYTKCGL